jgi:hypothetical protein
VTFAGAVAVQDCRDRYASCAHLKIEESLSYTWVTCIEIIGFQYTQNALTITIAVCITSGVLFVRSYCWGDKVGHYHHQQGQHHCATRRVSLWPDAGCFIGDRGVCLYKHTDKHKFPVAGTTPACVAIPSAHCPSFLNCIATGRLRPP